ncbi:MAG TPA: NADH-quinone oxidoreductase subunit M [Candidatus Acidoferrales bacterium]|nr:NADH-quinone oxidoreductase subunit M [Candidatus Acidoferrales bacterium]
MEGTHLLSIVTFLPLVGGLLLLLFGAEEKEWVRRGALAISVVTFVISLLLLREFDSQAPGYQYQELHRWIISPPIWYHLGIDGLSLWLVILTTFLVPLAVLCSWHGIDKRVQEFHVLLLALESAMIGVFVALDLFLFFLFFEAMLIPMFFLIGIWGHERRIYAAVKFVLYTMSGSILMLVAIVALFHLTGSFDLPRIQQMLMAGSASGGVTLEPGTERLLFLAFFVAFAIKVPLFPLHTWLPDAHVEAPTAGSVILAGVLLKVGTYGMIRFCLPLFPEATRQYAPWIAALAIVGIIYGALVAMVQPDYKKLVAYSSVSHLGFVVLGIFSLTQIGMQGAIYQMLNHGISTGGLFLAAGMLYDRRHTHVITEFGGLATPMPVYSSLFLFICLSSVGLPMLNGFVGEFLILNGAFLRNPWWGTLAATGVILSAVYLLWSYQRLIYGPVTLEKNKTLPDASHREISTLAAVCVIALLMGVASPLFLRRTEATVSRIRLVEMTRPLGYNAARRPAARPFAGRPLPELAAAAAALAPHAPAAAPLPSAPRKEGQP